jgi:ribosome maturation factor RimP
MSGAGNPATKANVPGAQLAAAVSAALDPVATAAGFDLEDVEVTPAGKRRLLRIVVDRDGGVDLDAVAEASRDASNVMGETPYVLEVTSPGVDRPLTLPRHWRRARGRLVEASTSDGDKVRGRVTEADDTTVTFDIDGTQRVIDLADLGDGHVQLEFNRAGGGAT